MYINTCSRNKELYRYLPRSTVMDVHLFQGLTRGSRTVWITIVGRAIWARNPQVFRDSLSHMIRPDFRISKPAIRAQKISWNWPIGWVHNTVWNVVMVIWQSEYTILFEMLSWWFCLYLPLFFNFSSLCLFVRLFTVFSVLLTSYHGKKLVSLY